MPGQTGGVTMAPLFAQRDTHMAAGFPLAITGRKEEINSKYSAHPPSLPQCVSFFFKAKVCGHCLQTILHVLVSFLCIFPLIVVRNEWHGRCAVLQYPPLQNKMKKIPLLPLLNDRYVSNYSRGSSYVQVCFSYKLTLIFTIALDFADLVARFLCRHFLYHFINIVIIFILLVNPNEQKCTMSCLSQSELV